MKLLALVCLLAACGNDPKPAHFIDAPPADAPIDVAIDAAPTAHFGRVEVSQGTSNGSASSGIDVTFSTDEWGPMVATDGPCKVLGTGTEPEFSAGTVTFTGTASTITASPTGTAPTVRYSATATLPQPAFAAGSTITISGAGGPDVPAFSGSVTAPAAIAGYTPPATTLSRAGYTATWTAGSGPTMWVIVAGFDSAGHGGVAICVVPDNGSFTVPASTFAMFPSTANMGFAALGRVAPMTTTVGGVMVTVQATSYVTSGDLTLTN